MSLGYIVLLALLAAIAIGVALSWSKVVVAVQGLRGFFNEVGFEMNKVTWPGTDEIVSSTVLVFIVAIALTLMVMVVDGVFSRIFSLLLFGGVQS